MPVGQLVGREDQLVLLAELLDGGAEAPALLLQGAPGIGKTTLWEVGARTARERGVRVLSSRPSEAETALSFAALVDLLSDVTAEVLAVLPLPQRSALEVALLRAPPRGSPPQLLAIAAGFLGVLRALSAAGPLLIAIDDIQWLDAASAEVLAFAMRRALGGPIRLLLAARPDGLPVLERALVPAGLRRTRLEGLSLGATRRVLSGRLGLTPPRPLLRRLFERAQGNPLCALELGRVLRDRGATAAGAQMPVSELVGDLFAERIAGISPPARRALLAVALGPQLRVSELAATVDPPAVDEGAGAGVLVVEGERVRASHPLLAAAALERSSLGERRELHAALARAIADGPRAARHVALSSATADAERARVVAAAAIVAIGRGATQDAVELAEHALALTPADDAAHPDRLLTLAEYVARAGDLSRVSDMLGSRVRELPAGGARARAHLLLAEGAEDAEHSGHLEAAIAESADEPALRATAVAAKVMLDAVVHVEQIERSASRAREVLPLALEAGGEVEARVRHALAWTNVLRGRPIDELLGSASAAPDGLSLYECSLERVAGVRLAFRGEVDTSRPLFAHLLSLADERGEALSCAVMYLQMCELELRAGDAHAAGRLLEEWDEWAAMDETRLMRMRCRALLGALRGDHAEAAEHAVAVRQECGLRDWDGLESERALGLAALIEHRLDRASERLGAVWQHTESEGVQDPGVFAVAADLVEALTEQGDIERATAVTRRLRELSERQAHPWGMITATRCEAVIELASGFRPEAIAALTAAAQAYRELGLRFDAARALLQAGRFQRRCRKWGAGRDSLQQAAAAFDELGGSGWAQRARAELASVGARRPAGAGELTGAEERVALLAADGLSNKEIARTLFVSVHTVEVHLSHVYAKLGIRSRAQLAKRLPAQAPQGDLTRRISLHGSRS